MDAAAVLDALSATLTEMSPQVRVAAAYILDNPGDVAVTSMRQVADAAGVKPNTLVRMARIIGFDGYEQFRQPFKQQVVGPDNGFPDRARFLQSISEGGEHGSLLADMAASALANVESLFAQIDVAELKSAADRIAMAGRTCVLGVGTARPLAENFAYVASMALDTITAIPTIGLAVDDVARMGPDDVLVAMTFSPYRIEIADAVSLARANGVTVISITDSWGSPIAPDTAHTFIVPNDSPLPFSSNVATVALLETLLAFTLADSAADVAAAIEAFHTTRRDAGIYTD